jgi:hypothetical protein
VPNSKPWSYGVNFAEQKRVINTKGLYHNPSFVGFIETREVSTARLELKM